MNYPAQLLEQARHLVHREPRKPRQGSLRRAVSNAYYALFHFFSAEIAESSCGTSSPRRALRQVMGRAISHQALLKSSRSFGGGNLPSIFQWTFPISPSLRSIADTLVKSQEERHRADYDLSVSFTRAESAYLVDTAEQAIQLWDSIRGQLEAELFLVALLIWNNLKDR